MLRRLGLIVGSLAIVVGSFFGTLFVLDRSESPATPDEVRASHARQIKAALEAYRRTKGQYPSPYGDNPLTGLQKDLVDGKFITAIPLDPAWGTGDNQYRYASSGKSYGLLFHLQSGALCLTGVGIAGSGLWNAHDCPF